MPIVSTCSYDAQGRLVRPRLLGLGRAKLGLDLDTGGSATFDRGCVHVHSVTASGLVAGQARERADSRLARFRERAESVTGYRTLAVNKTEGIVACNRNVTITYEIVYAVEYPRWTRGRASLSPQENRRPGRSMPVCR